MKATSNVTIKLDSNTNLEVEYSYEYTFTPGHRGTSWEDIQEEEEDLEIDDVLSCILKLPNMEIDLMPQIKEGGAFYEDLVLDYLVDAAYKDLKNSEQ